MKTTDSTSVTKPRYRYATRLNSFRSVTDGSLPELLAAAAAVPGLTAVEINYPQHLHGLGEGEAIVRDSGLVPTAISLRFDDPAFAEGAFTNPAPEVRDRAVRLAQDAVELAARLAVSHVNLWMATDGFDYPFAVDYSRLWEHEVDGFRRVAAHDPSIRVSVEYKPVEPRRVTLIAGMADALLAVRDVGLPNFGVQIDVCHSLMARERPAAAAALALREGRLFGVHLNDGYGPADDGLMVASVHPWETLELLWYLRRFGYDGSIYFDTFPERIDPPDESAANIRTVERLERLLDRLDDGVLARLQERHDALAVTGLIQALLFGEGGD